MRAAVLITLILLTSVNAVPVYADSNEKLADVMQLVSDQVAGLTELQKMVPSEASEKDFSKALHRARGAKWLFSTLLEKKGSYEEEELIATDLTPTKILAAAPEEQEQMLSEYEEYLVQAGEAFETIRAEVKVQSELKPEEKDFKKLKGNISKVFLIMSKAHKIFKP